MSLKTISKRLATTATMALLLFAATGQAQTVSAPRTLSYQGVLRSTGMTGNILVGNRLLTVTLYGDANGTIKLWQSTMSTPIDSSGVFNCTLGSADNPLPPPAMMDRAIWLGVAIDNAPELRPLSEVTASAYAINVADSAITSAKIANGAVQSASLADSAITSAKIANGAVQSANLADTSVTTGKIAEGAITWDKMGTEYVPYVRVNGAKVTTGHNSINFTGSNGLMVNYDSTSMSLIFQPDSALSIGTNGKGGMQTLGIPDTFWAQGGNNATTVPTDFIGTADTTSAFEIHLNDRTGGSNVTPDDSRIARFQYESASPDITMGYGAGSLTGNIIGTASNPSVVGSTIAGGGDSLHINSIRGNFDFIGSGLLNSISSDTSSIVGGIKNSISTEASASFIGGGDSNTIGPGPLNYSVIGGGEYNTITNTICTNPSTEGTQWHFIGGGFKNLIITDINSGAGSGDTQQLLMGAEVIGGGEGNLLDAPWGAITGGDSNRIACENPPVDDDGGDIMKDDFIGGGIINTIDSAVNQSFIGGGIGNHIAGAGTGGTCSSFQAFSPSATANRSVVGGGAYNDILSGNYATIGGGDTNLIVSDYGSIGGGRFNQIHATFGTIAGGDTNRIVSPAHHSAIGGGDFNLIEGKYGTIAGGDSNSINVTESGSQYDAIGGGLINSITNSDTSDIAGGAHNSITNAPSSAISGGTLNGILQSQGSIIGGGQNNHIQSFSGMTSFQFLGGGLFNFINAGNEQVIAGGDSNVTAGSISAIVGGRHNSINTNLGFIGGGDSNTIFESDYSAIGGGQYNLIQQPYMNTVDHSFIGGGLQNTINNSMAVIGGGNGNIIDTFADYSFIGGGRQNLIQGPWCVIAGGDSNNIYAAGADHNAIGGGLDNIEQNPSFGVIAGGWQNVLDTAAWGSAIGGGWMDSIQSPLSFIGGGDHNTIYYEFIHGGTIGGGQFNKMWYGENSFIGGGEFNHDSSNVSVIAGGDSNRLIGGSDYAAIGGGQDNVITGAGNHADIPGGDSLVAQSFAQTVLGFHNLPAGGFVQGSSSSFATNPAHANDPILIVGSGTKTSPSNALQVSYDGHTSVFDVNNNSTLGGRKAILGSTYQDNVLYAWGDIAGGALAGPPCTGAITEFGDFGVAQFTYVCTGHYRVQLSTEDALGNSITTWSDLSVTATPMSATPSAAATCVIAVVSPVGVGSIPNAFDIFLLNPESGCAPVDGRVSFHVCGRP